MECNRYTFTKTQLFIPWYWKYKASRVCKSYHRYTFSKKLDLIQGPIPLFPYFAKQSILKQLSARRSFGCCQNGIRFFFKGTLGPFSVSHITFFLQHNFFIPIRANTQNIILCTNSSLRRNRFEIKSLTYLNFRHFTLDVFVSTKVVPGGKTMASRVGINRAF